MHNEEIEVDKKVEDEVENHLDEAEGQYYAINSKK
jgi:hypothetical protein